MYINYFKKSRIAYLAMLLIIPQELFSMHIMEGFLPAFWCIFWYLSSLPFIILGLNNIKKSIQKKPELRLHLAIAGAFSFLLSALKIPSVSGSSSHPTGIGFGTILFGPSVMSVIGLIVLTFQAILLAHGGLTTLGANVFSMAIAGPFAGYILFKIFEKLNAPVWVSIFVCAFSADLFTYVITSIQLALAFSSSPSFFFVTFEKFIGIFGITQIPLAILEGAATYLLFNFIQKINHEDLREFKIYKGKKFHETI